MFSIALYKVFGFQAEPSNHPSRFLGTKRDLYCSNSTTSCADECIDILLGAGSMRPSGMTAAEGRRLFDRDLAVGDEAAAG
jgi:hypothetical protein